MRQVSGGAAAPDTEDPADSTAGHSVPEGPQTEKQHGVFDPHVALKADETEKEERRDVRTRDQ